MKMTNRVPWLIGGVLLIVGLILAIHSADNAMAYTGGHIATTEPESNQSGVNTDDWVQIINGDQGYALRAPETAQAIEFRSERVLHIVLPDSQQTLLVNVYSNPGHRSVQDWINEQYPNGSARINGETGPNLMVTERGQLKLNGKDAERFTVIGPAAMIYHIVLASGENIYEISYPVLPDQDKNLLESIALTFRVGNFQVNQGFSIFKPDVGDTINSLPVPYYSQRDSRWICDQLGTCNCNFNTCTTETFTGIGDAGCFITSKAMVFEYYTSSHYMNPQEYDSCLTNHNEYSSWSGCSHGLCAASYWRSSSSCRPSNVTYHSYSTNLSLLDSDLNSGYPAIALVDNGNHYVVVIGKSGGKYQINDPYYSRTQINPGEIEHFIRYHGPVPNNCCGCGTQQHSDSPLAQAEVSLTPFGPEPPDEISKPLEEFAVLAASLPVAAAPPLLEPSPAEPSLTPLPPDATAPEVYLSIAGQSTAVIPALHAALSIQASDDRAVTQMRFSTDRKFWSEWEPYAPRRTWQFADTDAPQTVFVQVRDAAGNISTPAMVEVNVNLESASPDSSSYTLAKSVMGMSGGEKTSSSYIVRGTGGQPYETGHLQSNSYQVLSGFWSVASAATSTSTGYTVFLPVTLR